MSAVVRAIHANRTADKTLGWAQEMYAFTLAMANLPGGPSDMSYHQEFMVQPPFDKSLVFDTCSPVQVCCQQAWCFDVGDLSETFQRPFRDLSPCIFAELLLACCISTGRLTDLLPFPWVFVPQWQRCVCVHTKCVDRIVLANCCAFSCVVMHSRGPCGDTSHSAKRLTDPLRFPRLCSPMAALCMHAFAWIVPY